MEHCKSRDLFGCRIMDSLATMNSTSCLPVANRWHRLRVLPPHRSTLCVFYSVNRHCWPVYFYGSSLLNNISNPKNGLHQIECGNLYQNWAHIFLWGLWLKVRGNGQGCVAVRYLTPYLVFFILPPRWLVGVMPCPRKSPKELYKRNRQKQVRDEDVSFILFFICWI